ncbi:MAG TPA: hypothetical protein VGI10_03570 [Polyangiaceae bacterium]
MQDSTFTWITQSAAKEEGASCNTGAFGSCNTGAFGLTHGGELCQSVGRHVPKVSHPRYFAARFWPQIVAVCAVLLLLGDVWSALHLLTVQHVRCPYDGALVHADELGSVGEAPAERPESSQPAAAVVHHHRSCAAFTAVHRVAFLAASAPHGEFCALSCTVLRALSAQAFERPPALTYAPKQSPPT